jgi:hypothetical protein
MKNVIATVLSLLISFSAFGQSSPPAVIDQLHPDPSLTYVTKVSDIPDSVIEVMKTATGYDKLKMANKGGKWNMSDAVLDPDLPFRRLIWAVEAQKHFVVHYEHGGIGYSTHFLVISPPGDDGKRKLEWAAVSFKKADNLKKFLTMAKSGKLDADESLTH